MFRKFKKTDPITQQQSEEPEGVKFLLAFKLSGETFAKIAGAVISAVVVGLITTVVIQAIKSPTSPPAETVRPPK